MNHGQSNSSMATTRTETTHGPYSVTRVIDVTTWQSVDAVCLCCLTHGACVELTGLQPLLSTASRRLPVAHVKEDGQSAVICPYHLHDLQRVLDQPVCSMHVQPGLTHSSYVRMCIFCDFLWPEVQSHSSHMYLATPCSACLLSQARPTVQCIHLVIICYWITSDRSC